jgi:peptidoglycan/LPS O-acetylase OafA/YrhL
LAVKNWIFELDYLRFIAIFAVLISHGYGVFGIQQLYPQLGSYMVRLGSVGVILFFIISGFLIAKIAPDSRKSLVYSFIGRILRIGPLYWTALLITAILFSLNLYQGFWIRNFDFYNVMLNALFLINFTPNYDIPPFWFISSLVLFNGIYLLLRYIFKNPFYYAISSLGLYFLLLTLEITGKIWATNSFIYFTFGTLLGIMYYARIYSLDRIKSVHPVISAISASSYPMYLFHLIIFGAVADLLILLTITNPFVGLGIALIITCCICIFIQKVYDRAAFLARRYVFR